MLAKSLSTELLRIAQAQIKIDSAKRPGWRNRARSALFLSRVAVQMCRMPRPRRLQDLG